MNEVFANVFQDEGLSTKNYFPEADSFATGEYRSWDAERSKLAAAIQNGLTQLPIRPGSVVLYLGAGHGYTPSFVSDIIEDGMVFCVDVSPRVMRDLIFVCEERGNMAPVLADASDAESFAELVPDSVDVVFQDVAQQDQVGIFVDNCDMYLSDGGFGVLAVKARSIAVEDDPDAVFDRVRDRLEEEMTVAEYRMLEPQQEGHALFVCKK